MGDILHTLPAATASAKSFAGSHHRLGRGRALGGAAVHSVRASLRAALPAAAVGRSGAYRRYQEVAVNSLFSPQTWERIGASLSEVRAPKYEIAVDFQGAVRSAMLARLSKAPVVYGAAQPRENVASMFYTRQVMARGSHVVEQNLSLAEAVAGTAARHACRGTSW